MNLQVPSPQVGYIAGDLGVGVIYTAGTKSLKECGVGMEKGGWMAGVGD